MGQNRYFAPRGKHDSVGALTKTLVLIFSISDFLSIHEVVIGFSFS